MSATRSPKRKGTQDCYNTPLWCVRHLLAHLPLPGGHWLEPCAGTGNIVQGVSREDVYWTAYEINENLGPDIEAAGVDYCRRLDQPVDVRIEDFLTAAESLRSSDSLFGTPFDVVITNPPYSFAQEFIGACLPLAPWVIMLLRVNYLASAGRAAWLREHTPDVYVLANRPSFVSGRTDATEYAWVVWHGEPTAMVPRSEGRLVVLPSVPRSERFPKEEKAGDEDEGED